MRGLPVVPRESLATLFVAVVVAAGLFTVDVSLRKTEVSEVHAEADRHYQRGKAGVNPVEELRQAHSQERENQEYTAEYASALIGAGNYAEAQSLLDELLQAEPHDGRINLLAARLKLKEQSFSDADAYFHRAIYGHWNGNAQEQRVKVRLELIRQLEARHARSDLLSELLPLESEADGNAQIQKEIGRLFLVAGSPARSITVFQQLIAKTPNDGTLYRSVGQAELEMGDYKAAQTSFLQAFRRLRNDPSIRRDLELASSLSALDPMPRRLSSAEKYSRSERILALAIDEGNTCLASLGGPPAGTPLQEALDQAQTTAKAAQPKVFSNEAAEQKLTEAEQVWKAQRNLCPEAPTLPYQELRLILSRLSQ